MITDLFFRILIVRVIGIWCHLNQMNTMCQSFLAKQATSGSKIQTKFWHAPLFDLCEQRNSFCSLNSEYQPERCRSCLEKYGQEVLTMNGLSPYATPPLSPMSSYASCSSSFGNWVYCFFSKFIIYLHFFCFFSYSRWYLDWFEFAGQVSMTSSCMFFAKMLSSSRTWCAIIWTTGCMHTKLLFID